MSLCVLLTAVINERWGDQWSLCVCSLVFFFVSRPPPLLLVLTKVVNSVMVGILFFQLEWNVQFQSVSMCRFGVVLFIYIYSINIIQIQDKLIINYTIQTQCQINKILKFKIFLNS
jgi:hypothetical protein